MPSALPASLAESLPAPIRARLQTARELGRRSSQVPDSTAFSTAIEPLDRLLEGGLPRGRLVELIGRKSSGRFSIVLSTLAAATAVAEATALVDLGDVFDPQAAKSVGTELEHVLWVRPRKLKEALLSAEMLLGTGFPLVVMDLGHPPIPGGRGAEAFWVRLARAATAQNASLLISSPYRVSGTAAATVVQARGIRPAWSGPLLTGYEARWALRKMHGQGTDGRARLHFGVDAPLARRLPPSAPTTARHGKRPRPSLQRAG